MAKYYGVERSEEYLAHYGIRGMKWGVRKAIERGNQRALSRHYIKAKKKLDKLTKRADIKAQRKESNRHLVKAGISAGIGAMGLTSYGLQKNASKNISINSKNLRSRTKKIVDSGNGINLGGVVSHNPVGNTQMYNYTHPSLNQQAYNAGSTANARIISSALASKLKSLGSSQNARKIALGVGLAGIGASAYHTGKGVVARYRTTKKGHAKAVAKRNAWQKEMNSVFKNKTYAKKRK